ncbi:hypothetical protein OS493_040381 [Desmophyllum pertusum]|uniref:Uncharacterized protein n=1 Tax=Desmophyllum pertusum TaxID=174260 RepID=A0A9W9Z8P2_9CNID|nr:hypothetical protein OS493_040381 [Desmophyllum pertusum]
MEDRRASSDNGGDEGISFVNILKNHLNASNLQKSETSAVCKSSVINLILRSKKFYPKCSVEYITSTIFELKYGEKQ